MKMPRSSLISVSLKLNFYVPCHARVCSGTSPRWSRTLRSASARPLRCACVCSFTHTGLVSQHPAAAGSVCAPVSVSGQHQHMRQRWRGEAVSSCFFGFLATSSKCGHDRSPTPTCHTTTTTTTNNNNNKTTKQQNNKTTKQHPLNAGLFACGVRGVGGGPAEGRDLRRRV